MNEGNKLKAQNNHTASGNETILIYIKICIILLVDRSSFIYRLIYDFPVLLNAQQIFPENAVFFCKPIINFYEVKRSFKLRIHLWTSCLQKGTRIFRNEQFPVGIFDEHKKCS